MDWAKVCRLLGRWRVPLSVVPCAGNPATFRGPRRWTAIDHMVTSREAIGYMKAGSVNRSWDLSDHWPLQSMIRGLQVHEEIPNRVAQTRLRIDISKLGTNREAIVDDNRWNLLGQLLEEEDDNRGDDRDLSVIFQETIGEIVRDLEIIKPPPIEEDRKVSYRLSKRAKSAIARRRRAYRKWLAQDAPSMQSNTWNDYLRCRKVAKDEVRKSSKASWLKFITKGAALLVDNDMGGFWNWVKQVSSHGKMGPADYGPIQMVGGNEARLAYTPEEKLQQWKLHYEQLLRDVTGHSRNEAYWEEMLPGPIRPMLDGLNGIITWADLNRVLHRIRTGTAPGCDGCPPELFKLAMNNLDSDAPDSHFGAVLLQICNIMWDNGDIPLSWNEAWVVSILKKGGDPKCMDNYRGISLIPVMVKIVTLIITCRLRDALESTNWFVKQQAGFRTLEECVGHVCCLYEILQRRKIMGKKTYVAFLDIKKAYDSVPIEALMRKLKLIGVDGKALAFFRGLYKNASVRVRTKYGLSIAVLLHRGLRQGCNASPLLFDIFINDILDECGNLGVKIVGLDAHRREVGLLFADDLALLCGNIGNLKLALNYIQNWATKFEMQFGVNKCGIIGFGNGAQRNLRNEAQNLILDNQLIPLVDEYTYLGVPFTASLNVSLMAAARAAKGRKCLMALRPELGCAKIPLEIRIRVIKALLIPVLTYGSEVWGMNEENCKAAQAVLSEALRIVVRLKPRCSITSSGTLGLEFGIDSIHAMASSARSRAYVKYPTLRTTIADLMMAPPVSRKRTWVTGSRMWLRRYCPLVIVEQQSSKVVANLVRESVRNRGIKNSITAVRYCDNGFEQSKAYLKYSCRYTSLSSGVHWLCRLRVNAFWTVTALQKIGWLPDRFSSLCPFCNIVSTGETIEHLLTVCRRWRTQRNRYLGMLLRDMGWDYINLLGGSRIESGVSLVDLLPIWLGPERRDVANEALQIGNDIGIEIDRATPGFVRVAKFLQEILPVRFQVLAELLRAPRADADILGMAILPEEVEDVHAVVDGTAVDIEAASEVDNRWDNVLDT